MPRLNIFENISNFHLHAVINVSRFVSLMINGVVIPGSISFNNVAMIFQASGTTAKTASISFGLYSLNGSTLSLANSASISTAPTANTTHWITLATSATQDITPGNWYFACVVQSSSNNNLSLHVNNLGSNILSGAAYGGVFVRGRYSATTNGLPVSIATSDLSKEGQGETTSHHIPYIIIAA